jgi:hypothetical protein
MHHHGTSGLHNDGGLSRPNQLLLWHGHTSRTSGQALQKQKQKQGGIREPEGS